MWDTLYWINETRAHIEDIHRSSIDFSWESKRVLEVVCERWQWQKKKNSFFALPAEYRGKHRPDAVLRYSEETDTGARNVISAIEIVLARHSYISWKSVVLDLLAHYTNIHFYTRPPAKESLVQAVRRFQCELSLPHEPSQERRQAIFIHNLEKVL